jgi:hypothetical protein
MNNDEAKFRLRAYRPGGLDAGDPSMSDALSQAERDPALRAWLVHEQAFDTAVASRLRTIEPPAGLRETILAGARVGRKRRAWLPPAWLAIAAMIAVVFALNAVWRSHARNEPLAAFARFAIDDVRYGNHGGHGEAEGALQKVLEQSTTHLAGGLPIDVTRLAGTGCRTLHFQGHEALEICFERNGATFHFYILLGGSLSPSGQPYLLREGGIGAVAWNDARYDYAVVGTTSPETMTHLL